MRRSCVQEKGERSFGGNFAFSNLCVLGFSANFPFVFSHQGVGGGPCCELLWGIGVFLSSEGSGWPLYGVLDAGRRWRRQV